MKIVIISDSHGYHNGLTLPDGDLLIHAGDVSGRGMESQVLDFLEWYDKLQFKHKIFIAGNHDFYFEQEKAEKIQQCIPSSTTYLNDSGTSIDGINIWGSPVSTWFYDWAFNSHKGEEIKKHWDKIPLNTDILITHGPPYGIFDKTHSGVHAGCEVLLEKVKEIKPKYHIFGHIHEGYGITELDGTTFINASVLTADYRLVNAPIIIDL